MRVNLFLLAVVTCACNDTRESPPAPPIKSRMRHQLAEAPPAPPADNDAATGPTKLLDNARAAFATGDFARAIMLAEPVKQYEPDDAWRLVGTAQCALKNRAGALESKPHVSPASWTTIVEACAKSGVKF